MTSVPNYRELLRPTLEVLKKMGGSASNRELSEGLADELDLSEEAASELHQSGPQTKLEYNAAWARTHLKNIGAVNNSSRGVWTLTEKGQTITDEEIKGTRYPSPDPRPNGDDPEPEQWKADLLSCMLAMDPSAFERLCKRLLREKGFSEVNVTGRAGDGGIDGRGVLNIDMLSFDVRFQCKRYSGSVGPGLIRDFRGALDGRADKGLFITTGAFTRDAMREAVRQGAFRIDLIDGSQLCDYLKETELGVEVVEHVQIDPDFFKGI